jgi:hypothetical protein
MVAGSSADRICISKKYAFLLEHDGQTAVVCGAFLEEREREREVTKVDMNLPLGVGFSV